MDIICDVDNTVANLDHRLHWIQTKPKNYEAFFAAVKQDTPIAGTIEVVQSLIQRGNRIIFCSGRPEKTRKDTAEWLHNNVHYGEHPLYMRKDKDYRPDYVIKLELLEQMKKDGFWPTIALDDRTSVLRAWESQNIFTLNCNQGKEFV